MGLRLGPETCCSDPPGTVLIVDSVFAFRPEYNDCWEYRIWLDVDPELALRRGIARDRGLEGTQEATRLHRDRYQVAEATYLAEVRPQARADAVIDNRDFTRPRILGRHNP
jgi:uridine kinase